MRGISFGVIVCQHFLPLMFSNDPALRHLYASVIRRSLHRRSFASSHASRVHVVLYQFLFAFLLKLLSFRVGHFARCQKLDRPLYSVVSLHFLDR